MFKKQILSNISDAQLIEKDVVKKGTAVQRDNLPLCSR